MEDKASSRNGDPSLVPAVARASAILTELSAAHGVPMSIGELSRRLELPKSSTANLCLALEAERLLVRHDAGYLLGRRLVELGGAYLETIDQVGEFYRSCREQPTISRMTARAAVLDGLDVLYLARYDGAQPIRMTANIGDRFPAHCAATGKALLAEVSPAVLQERLRNVDRLVALTPRSVTDPADLLVELDTVRRRGYATDEEEVTPGVSCIAIAVPSATAGGDAFAISVTTAASGLNTAMRERLLVELRAVAAALQNPLVPEFVRNPQP
ncbi:MAG: IclR family transcriptional regulator [Nakamurella sp.]